MGIRATTKTAPMVKCSTSKSINVHAKEPLTGMDSNVPTAHKDNFGTQSLTNAHVPQVSSGTASLVFNVIVEGNGILASRSVCAHRAQPSSDSHASLNVPKDRIMSMEGASALRELSGQDLSASNAKEGKCGMGFHAFQSSVRQANSGMDPDAMEELIVLNIPISTMGNASPSIRNVQRELFG